MINNLEHMWYHHFLLTGLDINWQNPRNDGTGNSAIERYSQVQDALRIMGREVLKSKERLNGMPQSIIVSNEAPEEDITPTFERLVREQGIEHLDEGAVHYLDVIRYHGDFIMVV
jgi:hypothetical protein